MLRKRAFDALRTDVLILDVAASLAEAAAALHAHLEKSPDMDAAAVTRQGRFVGLLGVREFLADLNGCALEASLRTSLGPEDFETTYREVCRHCLARKVGEAVRRDVPVVAPSEPLHLVLDAVIKSDSRFAAVVEGGSLLGLVSLVEVFKELRREFDRT